MFPKCWGCAVCFRDDIVSWLSQALQLWNREWSGQSSMILTSRALLLACILLYSKRQSSQNTVSSHALVCIHVCMHIPYLTLYMCAYALYMHELTGSYVPHIPWVPVYMYMSKCAFMTIWLTLFRSFLEESKLKKVNNSSQKIRNTSDLAHALLCTLCSYRCAHIYIYGYVADYLEEFSGRLTMHWSESTS